MSLPHFDQALRSPHQLLNDARLPTSGGSTHDQNAEDLWEGFQGLGRKRPWRDFHWLRMATRAERHQVEYPKKEILRSLADMPNLHAFLK